MCFPLWESIRCLLIRICCCVCGSRFGLIRSVCWPGAFWVRWLSMACFRTGLLPFFCSSCPFWPWKNIWGCCEKSSGRCCCCCWSICRMGCWCWAIDEMTLVDVRLVGADEERMSGDGTSRAFVCCWLDDETILWDCRVGKWTQWTGRVIYTHKIGETLLRESFFCLFLKMFRVLT